MDISLETILEPYRAGLSAESKEQLAELAQGLHRLVDGIRGSEMEQDATVYRLEGAMYVLDGLSRDS